MMRIQPTRPRGLPRRCTIAACLMTVALPAVKTAPAAGQRAATDTLTLMLDEAYRVATLSNPAYRQTVHALTLNGPETRETLFDQILPSVSVTPLTTNYNGQLTQQTLDFFGNPIENPESSFVYNSSTQQSVSFNWSIQGNNLVNYRKRQRLTNRDRELAGERALAELRANVRRQYFAALMQQELLEAENELLETRRVDLQIADQLFRLAERTRVDVLNAELGIEQQGLAINRQERVRQRALLALRTTLGDAELPPIRLQAEVQPVFDPSDIEVDRLVVRAMEANPQVRQGDAAVRSAAHGVKEERTTWWPRLNAAFLLGRVAQTRGSAALFDLKPENDTRSSISFTLSLPFFGDFFQNKANIARAVVGLDNADEELRSTRLAVSEQVRSASFDLGNEYESYRLAQRSLEIAQEALRLAREEYRIGTRTFEQFRESIDSEADTRRQVIEARYGFVDALVTLEEAAGVSIEAPPPIAGGR